MKRIFSRITPAILGGVCVCLIFLNAIALVWWWHVVPLWKMLGTLIIVLTFILIQIRHEKTKASNQPPQQTNDE